MISTQSTASVHWRLFTKSERATSTNKLNDKWQCALGTFAFLASATVHTVIIALLINNAAEPLPVGRPLVVELVVEQETKPIIGDSTKKLKSSVNPIITDKIDTNIAEIELDRIEGPSLPTVVAPIRSKNKISVEVTAAPKLFTAIPELKSTDVQMSAPRKQKNNMGRQKPDHGQHLKSKMPVQKHRRKPPLLSKTQRSPASPKKDGTVLPKILEEKARTVFKQDDKPKIHGVQTRFSEEIQTEDEGTPRRSSIALIGQDGLKTKNHVGSDDIGEAAQLPGNPPPRYPARAIRRGWQGRVILDVEVLPSGKTGQVHIGMSSGYRVLDKSAQNTVKKWRFKAARRAGIPYRSKIRVPVQFRLKK